MYFPILRGRQFELLALRELTQNSILSKKIVPIIEPVKVSSTYTTTVDSFIKADRKIAVIQNPQVGSWEKDFTKLSNEKIKAQAIEQLKDNHVIPAFYVTANFASYIDRYDHEKEISSSLLICNNPDNIRDYEHAVSDGTPLYNLIPDRSDFRRRIRVKRVLCEDRFPKQTRNIDYAEIDNEFFSSDHLYYLADGYEGFSDYSVVGKEYSETGFAPYAVAIHIVYFDEKYIMRIAHFVSDSNDDISDPARKFAEAAEKLVKWNRNMHLETEGIKALESLYHNKTYPGLGVVKKYSIMHHLQLMGDYLDRME